MFWASIVAFVALPPWLAGIDNACPRTQALPARAPRSASPDQGQSHATQTTRSSREGAMALSQGSGPAGIGRCSPISPS
jgi:hypothetical protein